MSVSQMGPADEPPQDRLDRIDELLSLLLDENLTGEGLDEIERLLAADPVARRRYVDLTLLDGDLREWFAERAPGVDPPPAATPPPADPAAAGRPD